MLSFITHKTVKGVVVLLAIVVLKFFLIRLAPGDPAAVMAGEAGASDAFSSPSCARSSASTSRFPNSCTFT